MSSAPAPKLTPDQIARIDEDRSTSVIAVSTLFIVLCTVAVGLRFYARHNRRLRLELDDWAALAALVSHGSSHVLFHVDLHAQVFVILYCVSCILGKHS